MRTQQIVTDILFSFLVAFLPHQRKRIVQIVCDALFLLCPQPTKHTAKYTTPTRLAPKVLVFISPTPPPSTSLGKPAGFWSAVSAIRSAGIITFVIGIFQHITCLKRRGRFSWWRLLKYGITCAFPKAIATAALVTAMATFLPLWVAMITFFGQLLHHQ